ncbi:leucine-rich repeat domain-containing protein [Sphingobacterium bambusae]|uniref:Leucine-rich repeat domain-containing protein n=1 Tax=Sphingobacterium bambusae TaxID=662858 RepID=A0ABW6BJT4_9SPHI|nr:hypothetical protein [Sphingobacterium bambusae]WPL49050.1 hypothetical protein SCB77_01050 [Sphingobacterium bambusae]
MKKLNTFLLAFMLLGSTAVLQSCSKDDAPVAEEEEQIDENTLEVEFENADLASFIREQLELATTAKITRGDLKKLSSLNIRTAIERRQTLANVSSLKGLEHATELTLLDFGNTKVNDLTPIAGLTKVTYLRMNETPVTDLSPVADYTTLTYFNANQAGSITDIAALDKNVNIEQIILRGNAIGDKMMTTIAKFGKLSRLNIRSTGVTNITVLGEMMAKGALLKTTPGYVETDAELDLRGNNITDFSPIQSYIDDNTAVPVSM